MLNPLNKSQMSMDFPSAMTNCAPAFTQACVTGSQPPVYMWPVTSGFEDEQSYNPATNQIYATSHLVPAYEAYVQLNASTYLSGAVNGEYSGPCPQCGYIDNNSTTWDINASTGQTVWHNSVGPMTYTGYRGMTTESGNVVYLTMSTGDIMMLNAQTGEIWSGTST